MRVLFLVDQFPALTETFILDQVTGLIDRGHDVEIFAAMRGNRALVDPQVERYGLLGQVRHPAIVRGGAWRGVAAAARLLLAAGRERGRLLRTLDPRLGPFAGSSRRFSAAAALLDAAPYDIVHAHFGPNGLLGAGLRRARILDAPLVTTFYGYDVSSWVRKREPGAYAPLFSRGDLFLALSGVMEQRLIGLGCDPERLRVHHLGVSLAAFPVLTRRLPPGTTLRVLTPARLIEKKGLENGIHAVARLVKAGRDLRLDIAGDGPLREPLTQLIARLGVEGRVHLRGWLERGDMRKLLDAAHILMLPSVTAPNGDQEGTPTVLLEAMASGLPVVATEHGGIPEQITDGAEGYLVPEHDVDALASRLARLADHPEQWAEMGRRGRLRIASEFDIDTLNDRLVALYRQLTGDGPSAPSPESRPAAAPGQGSASSE